MKNNFGPVALEEKGFLFEGLSAQILRAYKSYNSLCKEIYYWSPLEAKATEVDFILEREEGLTAIEVKAKERLSAIDYKGLKAVQKLPGVKRRILVYMGKDIRKTVDGIEIQPFDFFCKNLKENFQADPSDKRINPPSRPFPVFSPLAAPASPLSENEKTPDKYEFLSALIFKQCQHMSFKPSQSQLPPPANEELFEALCLDLYKAEFGGKTQKNGRRGQSQNGVDIFASDQDIGVQCKKRDYQKGKITEKELKEEVKKAMRFQPPLRRFILAATCQRDVKIQEAARKISKKHQKENLFSVEIHSWDEIKELLDKHPKVYEKHYLNSIPSIFSDTIKTLQSESRHQELNRIKNLLNQNKPQTALELLKQFEKDKEGQLEDKEKYRLLTNKGSALKAMRKDKKAAAFLIQALQFNKENEAANTNCALAYLICGDLENSKKFVEKAKALNPLSAAAFAVEMHIKDTEGRTLEEIASPLPPAIKENHQTAIVLSYISLKRKRFAEAKKQLDIFSKKEPMEASEMADYAGISLKLILERSDVFSGRRAPESLKPELQKIINIYKKLNTDSQYSGLRRFQPEWPVHYALALELNGELDEAVFALETGITIFPENEHLKIKLSRLFEQKGDKEKSIDILEQILNLNPSAVSIKSTASGALKIREESFHLALILIDLYFQSNKNQEGQRLLDQAIQSSYINSEQKREAQQYFVFRMISFGKIESAEKQADLLFEKNPNDIFTLILKSKIENYWEKEKAKEGGKSQSEKHRLEKIKYLKKACQLFKDKKHEEQAGSNIPYFESRERLRDIEHLSQALYQSGMYPEAEPLLEEITSQNLNHPEIFKLLRIYFRNGKNREAVDLGEALIKHFPDKVEPVTVLFQLHQELGDTKKAVQYYENFIQVNPTDSKSIPIKLDLMRSYIESGQMEKARKLLKDKFDINSLSSNMINHLSTAYFYTGSVKKALKIQYQNIKKHPGKVEAEKVYFIFFTLLDKPKPSDFEKPESSKAEKGDHEDTSFLHPQKADLDCYIRIKDINSPIEQDILIEKNAEIYTLEHPLSKALLGKKPGDQILFEDKTYQIMEIKSKYIHKHQEIIKSAELRYGPKTFLKSSYISKKLDIKELSNTLRELAPDISKRAEQTKQLFQVYRKGKASVGMIAKATGRHPLEAIGHFIFSKEDKWISAFHGLEHYKKAQDHLENSSSLLLDLFSLAVLHQIRMEESLANSKFNLYVCQSTIDSLKDFINTTASHSKSGLLTADFNEKGELRKSFVPAKDVKRSLNFWIKLKDGRKSAAG